MPVTDQDARALTYLAKRLRDEVHGANRWDEAGIYAVVSRMVGQNLATTIERVTRHAADPTAKTPGAIERPFVPEAPGPQPRYPAKDHEACPAHPGEHADNCRPCAANRIVGEPEPPRRRTPGVPAPAHWRDALKPHTDT